MLAAVIAALAIGAPAAAGTIGVRIGVRIEEARDVRPDEIERLSAIFSEMIRASDRSGNTLSLRLQGAPTKIRLLAELLPSTPPKKIVLDIPRDATRWKESLLPIALDFFPPSLTSGTKTSTLSALVAPPRIEDERSPRWSYVALGVGVVAAASGAVLAVSSARANDRLNNDDLMPAEIDELRSAANSRGIAADVLIGTALVAVAAGVVMLVAQ